MKKLKISIGSMALSAMFLISGNAFCARQEQNAKMTKMPSDLSSELNLSVDQKSKVEGINKDTQEKMKALKTNASLDKEAIKAQRKSILEEKEKKLEAVLSKDQYAKLKELRKSEKEERKSGSGN